MKTMEVKKVSIADDVDASVTFIIATVDLRSCVFQGDIYESARARSRAGGSEFELHIVEKEGPKDEYEGLYLTDEEIDRLHNAQHIDDGDRRF